MIHGTIMGLADLTSTLDGRVDILIDRSHLDQNPAGIVRPLGFDPLPDSYIEPIQ